MTAEFWNQTMAVLRLEIRKTFLSRRSLWIYLLALIPVALFFLNSIYAGRQKARLARVALEYPVSTQDLQSINRRMTLDQVVERLGEPYRKNSMRVFAGPQRGATATRRERHFYSYTDGETDVQIIFMDGAIQGINRRTAVLPLDRTLLVFASVFQLYFVRLAIFFGCAGVFTNLFRGEMLAKSLHFYLLAPVPREALLLGKYLAGLIASAVIFSVSTGLQFYALLRQYDSAQIQQYLQNGGWDHVSSYMTVAALACVGYGSVFLAAGLVYSNPTVLAALFLLWESVNPFVPEALKKLSLIFYLQSLSPVEAPRDTSIPPFLQALVSSAEPAGIVTAIVVILAIAASVLFLGSIQARKLEINYSAD
jgi:hypothetical protein